MKRYIGNNCSVELTSYEKSISSLVAEKIKQQEAEQRDDAFFISDLGDIINKYDRWISALPRVKPFYAVKCNDNFAVLQLLADLGTSFDCASKREIEKVLDFGVSPDRIVYANPCKQRSFLKYAAKKNVSLMTFDNEDELHKVKALYPDAKLVLRILPPAHFKVQCELGMKFGCLPKKARHLLEAAKALELNVMGISFHVGSGCEEAEAFAVAVEQAREVFDIGLDLGFDMTLLDIGGGFPGQKSASITFEEIAEVLNMALDKYFPAEENVEIIAEPGRYFVASAFTLAVNIIAKRTVARDQHGENDEPLDYPSPNDEPSMMYYVNDGVYGSFNCLLYDHATVSASVIQEDDSDMVYSSSVWGPTCDGLDCILQDVPLPDLRAGSWLYFEEMGAYTMAAASTFNGMPPPRCFFICDQNAWTTMYPESSAKYSQYIRKAPPMKAGHLMEETTKLKDELHSASATNETIVGFPCEVLDF